MTTQTLEVVSATRKRFLEAVIGLFGLISAIGVLYPVGMFLWPRRQKIEAEVVKSIKIPLSDVPIGEAKFIRFLNKATVIIHTNDQELVALSAVCTHLGCIVKWNESKQELICPCHGGRFDTKGNVLGGPPPSPLVSYSVGIEDEYIVIQDA